MAERERVSEIDYNWKVKRLRGKNKAAAKKFIVERDGCKCHLCAEPAHYNELEFDHLDNDCSHNNPENLKMAHHRCNARRGIKTNHAVCVSDSMDSKLKSESKEQSGDATLMTKEVVDYSVGSPEMQVASFAETGYRNWTMAVLKVRKQMRKKDAIAEGAEAIGISVVTAERYLRKLVSAAGPLMEFKNPFRQIMIKIKPLDG